MEQARPFFRLGSLLHCFMRIGCMIKYFDVVLSLVLIHCKEKRAVVIRLFFVFTKIYWAHSLIRPVLLHAVFRSIMHIAMGLGHPWFILSLQSRGELLLHGHQGLIYSIRYQTWTATLARCFSKLGSWKVTAQAGTPELHGLTLCGAVHLSSCSSIVWDQ